MSPEQAQHILRSMDTAAVANGAALHLLIATLLRNSVTGVRATANGDAHALGDAITLERAAEVLERYAVIMRQSLSDIDAMLEEAIDCIAAARRANLGLAPVAK